MKLFLIVFYFVLQMHFNQMSFSLEKISVATKSDRTMMCEAVSCQSNNVNSVGIEYL